MRSPDANPTRSLRFRMGQGLSWLLSHVTGGRPRGQVRRILVLRFDHLGDCVLSTPALRLLRRRYPAARIEVASKAATADVFRHCPAVDAVRVFDAPWSLTPAQREVRGGNWRHFVRDLRRGGFDLGIDLQGDVRNVWMLAMAGVPRRAGARGCAAEAVLTDAVAVPDDLHRTLAAMAIVAGTHRITADPTPVFEIDTLSAAWAENALADGPDWMAVHPGAANRLKQWPLARFAEVAGALRGSMRIVVLAGPGEDELPRRWRQIPGGEGDLLLSPPTLGQLAATLARSHVLLCNDSGPMHVATAVGTPVAALFGATSPRLYGPIDRTRNRVLQSTCDRAGCWVPSGRPACERRCIATIETDRVIEAVNDLLLQTTNYELRTTNSPEAPCTAAS